MKLLISLSASVTEGHVFLNPVYFLKTNGLTLKDSYGKREIDPGAVAAAEWTAVYKGKKRVGSLHYSASFKSYEFIPVADLSTKPGPKEDAAVNRIFSKMHRDASNVLPKPFIGAPSKQVGRWLAAMANTINSTDEELVSKVRGSADSKSCYGLVALTLRKYLNLYKGDMILFVGANNYAEHVLLANRKGTTYDTNNGELRKDAKGVVTHWKFHTTTGDANTWTTSDVVYAISVKDFYRRYVTAGASKSQSAAIPDDSEFIPPASVAKAAARSLEWRKQYGRAMTPVGIARARQLKNRQRLSLNTIRRMVSYFARHEVDKQAKVWTEGHRDGGPSNGKIAWYGWGGDAGRTWATKLAKKYT